MEWAQAATIIGVVTAVVGLQTFWIARALDTLRGETHRGFVRLDARIDRLEGREQPAKGLTEPVSGGRPQAGRPR